MSYYHQDSQYDDYGNHGNEYNAHNEYSDHAEPDYPDTTPSEPDHYEYDNGDHEGDTDEWETKPEGPEYEHGGRPLSLHMSPLTAKASCQ
jgi:hypothetical protein